MSEKQQQPETCIMINDTSQHELPNAEPTVKGLELVTNSNPLILLVGH